MITDQSSTKQLVEIHGYAFIESLHPGETTKTVAQRLGMLCCLRTGESPIQVLKPTNCANAKLNTYSGMFGLDDFPFHTDMAHWFVPPKYIILRCMTGSPLVNTPLLDGYQIVSSVGEALMARAVVQPRRAVNGKISHMRIYEPSRDTRRFLRWDSNFIRPSSPNSKICMDAFETSIRHSKAANTCLWRTGDTLVIDNWRMLHARTYVPPDAQNRLIERAYLEELH